MLKHRRVIPLFAIMRYASLNMEGLQLLVDQQRQNAKVSTPVKASQVIDYTFVEKARKDIGNISA